MLNNKYQTRFNSQKAKEASVIIASIPLIILVALYYYINTKIYEVFESKFICGFICVVLGIIVFLLVELFVGFMYFKVFKGKELEKLDFILSLDRGELIPVYFKVFADEEYCDNDYNDEASEDLKYKYYLQCLEDNNMYIVVQNEGKEEVYRETIEDLEIFKNIFYVNLNKAI